MIDPIRKEPEGGENAALPVAVAASLPIPVLLIDRDGRVVSVNDAARHLLGERAEVGATLDDLAVTFDDAARLLQRLGAGETITGLEMAARAGRGEIWALVAAAPAGDGYALYIQDATELARRVERESQGREQVQRAMEAKMRFFAAASHDLRQPLQAIALFVSALAPYMDQPNAQHILHSIRTSLRTMEEMFEALLDMSRLEAGVLKVQRRDFMIGDVLEALECEYAPQAEQRGIGFTIVPSSETVCSDQALLTRILRNLLSNALRYTDRGRILVGCRHRGDSLRVEVWDTGRGIPEHQRQAIFEEFYRGDCGPGVEKAGMGLGLSIVQRLARLLNHRLDVRSQAGKGSVFAVEVPLADGEGCPACENESQAARGWACALTGCTVVVIDDDADILEGLRLTLERWGCHPIMAASGEEAVRTLDGGTRKPDVVLADLRLRESDGTQAIQTVYEALGGPVPAILFTGDTKTESRIDVGGVPVPVLRKPIDPDRLAQVLAEAAG